VFRSLAGSVGLCALFAAPAPAAGKPDPAALAAVIDRIVGDTLRERGVPPAPPADDATFFRRVHLSLVGRIPAPADIRVFLADPSPDKRTRAVEQLLASPEHVTHLTTTWRGWLLPEADTDPQVAASAPQFEAWLKARLTANAPLDKLVTELLTAPVDGRAATARRTPADDTNTSNGVLAFYIAKEAKPENLAAATSRLFLGVRLECAQCHNHPFAKWSRDQFWGLAAFFGGIERADGGMREVLDRREMLIPNADRTAAAAFLDDTEPEWRYKKSPRVTLAAWVTAPDNPFFARATANRLWGFLFGVGIVDPIDDFHEQNPPSHPALLDALASAFVESGFDQRFLLRAITLSDTYRRSSGMTEPGQRDIRLFARFPVQGLTPDQLFDSFAAVTGPVPTLPPAKDPAEEQARAQSAQFARRQFAELFARTDRKTDTQTSIVQALALMNGPVVAAATIPAIRADAKQSPAVCRVGQAALRRADPPLRVTPGNGGSARRSAA
jgi:hypothetical protein